MNEALTEVLRDVMNPGYTEGAYRATIVLKCASLPSHIYNQPRTLVVLHVEKLPWS